MKQPTKEQALEKLAQLKESFNKQSADLQRIIEDADKPKTITERVFDLPSAIIELGEADEDVKEYRKMQSACSEKTLAGKEIELFCKAVNEGTKMDWENQSQEKWYIWHDFSNKNNSRFVINFYYYCYYSDGISSRLTYKNRDLAVHGSKCMDKQYKKYLN